MLGQIANYCPIISRNTIVRNTISLENIWQVILLHFGSQTTGAHLLDFNDIQLQLKERPGDLYQLLVAFVEDNLLTAESNITHHGEHAQDEELTPSLENVIVLTWLCLVHPGLPRLVKQRYGTELRSPTLASIKPEISQALSSLLDERQCNEEAMVMRTYPNQSRQKLVPKRLNNISHRPAIKVRPLCKQSGRQTFKHFLSTCTYLPESDRRFITNARHMSIVN